MTELTIWDLVAVLRRQWLVVACGLLLSLLALGYVSRVPGVYWTQVNVIFLLPQNSETPNSLQFQTESLVTLAGIEAKAVGENGAGAAPTSDGVTLVGEGIYDGYSMLLPNAGGQWAINFDKPLLDVQVSGSTAQEVQTHLDRVVVQIQRDLSTRQQAAGVAAQNVVTTRLSPPVTPVYYNNGSHLRAMVATLLLAAGLTATAAVVVDRRRSRASRADVSDSLADSLLS
jgi:hypothetical protein